MILTPEHIEILRQILDTQTSIFIGSSLGPEFLTERDREILESYGVDVDVIYSEKYDPILHAWHFGILSEVLNQQEAKKVTFDGLVKYIAEGRYVPLSEVEKKTLDSIKMQSLADIKAVNGQIFKDINGLINIENQNQRQFYEEIIRDEIYEGVKNRESVKKIVQNLGNKTGDWSRQWGRMVEFVSHQAFDEGRAAVYKRRSIDGDPLVYKKPYEGACKHCIRVYLIAGIGSQPKVFKLSELEANGTNIGRKPEEMKAVVGSTHNFCRCTLHHVEKGQAWNEESQSFEYPEDYEHQPQIQRSKVKVTYNSKEYFV